jgi:2-polyprenyl-6-methoxyphenol hydroxylase-like FAD-dependent oxidoreductase
MSKGPRVAIVGGGIGGLTAAVAMHGRGIDVKVYEQSLQITEIGAGVSLSPNAIKALRALGLAVPIAEIGFESDHQLVRTWNTGDIVSKVFRKGVYEKEFGAPYLSMHRADLVDVLRRQLPEGVFRLGMQCVRAEADESKGRVYFADGSVEEADIVVGADGIRSSVRRSLFGDESPRFTGSVCWRGLVPLSAFPPGLISTDLTLYMGPRSHVIHFMVRGGRVVNFVAHVETSSWTGESWTQECDRSEALQTFAGWHPPLLQLLSASERYYKWALYDREPLDRWTKGRATLLGDSAHAMLPHIGQGACMAIEDGYALAEMVAQLPGDLNEALRQYERLRLPRTRRAVLEARARGKEMHLTSKWAQIRRNVRLAFQHQLGGDKTGLKLAEFYEYDVASASRLPDGMLRASARGVQ